MLATGLGHRRGEFCVGQSDNTHDAAADNHGNNCSHGARIFKPTSGQDNPAEADHRAKAEGQSVNIA